MSTFTLTVLEQVGNRMSSELRYLGQRHVTAATLAQGKGWLSCMLTDSRLEGDRFYRFESDDCMTAMRDDFRLNIAFYLLPDRRLCPVRIWSHSERAASQPGDLEWTVDFEGLPGWSFIASVEPRWRCVRTVPPEQPWIGQSRRDWQRRNCYTPAIPSSSLLSRVA